jgi:hypothetical protein
MTLIIFGTRFYFATKQPESLWRRLPPERFRLWQHSGSAGAGPLCCGSESHSTEVLEIIAFERLGRWMDADASV